MNTKIDKYKMAKELHRESEYWAELLGKEYTGGGGGVGSLRYASLDTREMKTPTIYHQAYDGARNYHPAPKEFLKYLDAEIRSRFPEILAAARGAQAEKLKELAAEARQEHEDLMVESGLLERDSADA